MLTFSHLIFHVASVNIMYVCISEVHRAVDAQFVAPMVEFQEDTG
jgi:hypothetical protein